MKLLLLLQCITSVAGFVPVIRTKNRNFHTSHDQQSEGLWATSNLQQQLGEFEKLNIQDDNDTFKNLDRSVRLYDLSASDPIEYRSMWEIQKSLVNAHVNRLKVEFQKKAPESQFMDVLTSTSSSVSDYTKIPEQDERIRSYDSLILLQHQPVYTLGTGSDAQFLKLDEERLEELGIDLLRIERGGEITYHGPGQLTVYPIFDLRGYKQDIHWYVGVFHPTPLCLLYLLFAATVSFFFHYLIYKVYAST